MGGLAEDERKRDHSAVSYLYLTDSSGGLGAGAGA
jgi:hypothetical protein